MDPWSGLGVGYEILSTSQTAQGITVSALPEFFARPVLERFFWRSEREHRQDCVA